MRKDEAIRVLENIKLCTPLEQVVFVGMPLISNVRHGSEDDLIKHYMGMECDIADIQEIISEWSREEMDE